MTDPGAGRGTVRMVWAQAHDRVLGADGTLPWHLPEDLRLFKALTIGSTVVMGRRTWESLPARVRPLPGRRNVVLSSTLSAADAGVPVARSVADALAGEDDVWVIGGGGVYAGLLPHAAEVVVTDIDAAFPGDAFAPALDAGWRRAARVPGEGWLRSSSGLRFAVSVWTRTDGVPATAQVVADALAAVPEDDGTPS
ncbi:dihydrofolate reductase [Modestobacter sp. SSW1-42]|uniref:dihydrofolate reductase n=1 Tax=Modestobacter sp. SSW1-42 TaxID=596372 RepID=UPI0039889B36